MAENDSLLAYLSHRLTSRTEDIAVQALEYILNKSAPCMRALEGVIREGGVSMSQIARVQPWASGENMTIPDLVGVDDSNVERVLVEAKFWAGLTEHQPNGYLNRLPKGGPSVLLFIAPAQRTDTLWASLRYRIEENGGELGPVENATQHRRSASLVDTEGYLMLISWSHLLTSMSNAASANGDSAIEADIRQLRGLAEREDAGAFMPLHPDELSPNAARRIHGFWYIAEAAIRRGESQGVIDTVRGFSNWYGGRGYNLRLCGLSGWFGVDCDLWRTTADTPFWLYLRSISIDKLPNSLRSALQVSYSRDALKIPVRPKTGVEQDQVVEDIVTQLKRIADTIKEATGET